MVIEQRPELRKALQVRPVAVMTAVDSSWDIYALDSHVSVPQVTTTMTTSSATASRRVQRHRGTEV